MEIVRAFWPRFVLHLYSGAVRPAVSAIYSSKEEAHYMSMGTDGMHEHTLHSGMAHMKLPQNTLAMMTGKGQFGPIGMGKECFRRGLGSLQGPLNGFPRARRRLGGSSRPCCTGRAC